MKIYVVRSSTGLYFRAKGLGGRGDSWVESLEKAKLYTKIGPAKSTCTFWTRSSSDYGIPDILEFELDCKNAKILDTKEETLKSVKRINEKEEIRKTWNRVWMSGMLKTVTKSQIKKMTSEERKQLIRELERT